MSQWIENRIFTWMLVPPTPHPPEGSAESVRIFRSGPNYYKWRIAMWLLANMAAAGGLFIGYLIWARVARTLPHWGQLIFYAFEALAIAGFLASLPFTFLQQHLNFQLRWYIVTDRSLRIRSGIWSIQELTTTFANIQEIRVSAGPLQKLLGLADVEVHSAGGGGGGRAGKESGHIARFEGVDNANEIRDVIVDRLRQYRDSGLGETARVDKTPANMDAIAAARRVLEEARALREAMQKVLRAFP